jgi:O-antigen/teichoic acid export membrane protein
LRVIKFPRLIIGYFNEGHIRSVKAKKNIFASFGFSGLSILVSFLLVPLTLAYLSPIKYGIWLTLSSVVAWFNFFDIGLGNGLRNKLTEAFAVNDDTLAKVYVSTTYAVLILVSIGLLAILLILNRYLNWSSIFNSPPEMSYEINMVVIIVFTLFSFRFVLRTIGVIFTADQLPAYNRAITSIGNILALFGIYILTKHSTENLLYISIVYSSAPVIVWTAFSILFFNGKYKFIKPSIKSVNIKYIRPLASLGIKFFILQIATVVIFSTDNIIIAKILGPEEVTSYNIAFKYFSLSILLFTIIVSPYWSAITDAATKNDNMWIANSIKSLFKIWSVLVIGILLMLIVSQRFYFFWIGSAVTIPLMLSCFMAVYAIIITFSSILSSFLNGVGIIKIQMFVGIIQMIINVPISIYFAKYLQLGNAGVILGTCATLIIGVIIYPIQYHKYINNTAKGIWRA